MPRSLKICINVLQRKPDVPGFSNATLQVEAAAAVTSHFLSCPKPKRSHDWVTFLGPCDSDVIGDQRDNKRLKVDFVQTSFRARWPSTLGEPPSSFMQPNPKSSAPASILITLSVGLSNQSWGTRACPRGCWHRSCVTNFWPKASAVNSLSGALGGCSSELAIIAPQLSANFSAFCFSSLTFSTCRGKSGRGEGFQLPGNQGGPLQMTPKLKTQDGGDPMMPGFRLQEPWNSMEKYVPVSIYPPYVNNAGSSFDARPQASSSTSGICFRISLPHSERVHRFSCNLVSSSRTWACSLDGSFPCHSGGDSLVGVDVDLQKVQLVEVHWKKQSESKSPSQNIKSDSNQDSGSLFKPLICKLPSRSAFATV